MADVPCDESFGETNNVEGSGPAGIAGPGDDAKGLPPPSLPTNPLLLRESREPRLERITIQQGDSIPEGVRLFEEFTHPGAPCLDAYCSLFLCEGGYVERVRPDYPITVQQHDPGQISQLFDNLLRCANQLSMCETAIYLAADMVHRVLSRIQVRQYAPYLLASALFVSQKLEPSKRSIAHATRFVRKLFGRDNEKTHREALFHNELALLQCLDYRMEAITPYSFLTVFCSVADFGSRETKLVHYLTQIAIITWDSYRFYPSMITAAAVLLVRETFNYPCLWSAALVYHTGYLREDLLEARQFLLESWWKMYSAGERQPPPAVYAKFVSSEFDSVAEIKPPSQ
ncbi:Cyclin A [Giardia muris]|uniref:Cyclin A n=1 Tax=Giardia muris TaxID=5742 RepID=A0A4Z1SL89_GIAMU|nr:Cyclin A [Giardia muris]|eukprot:TNJ26260.1 Cyclin A [Giardia muris]